MSKEKIVIIGCTTAMDTMCIGCSRCMVAFNRRKGEFERYDESAELTAIIGCGGCPGVGVVTRMAHLKLWNTALDEVPTIVHIAPCITNYCPHKDILIAKIKAKAGCEVVEGTHHFFPDQIFA
ncbi:Predicted metal-binding protein [Maridesulfovibrio ferrireducens]|uniref:Predicted metal-binding protein n=1 Tax=Maridesulfovibrio ferrireducens TaxID=246191 RepID=A0A1G9HDY0_9BACT|nr:CGGC domain-containing protein [Maridesulfovibrio ferrireducens]SDL11062.1 Predicted metal-binding protein [Maridesulfovibrio ferrireducens]